MTLKGPDDADHYRVKIGRFGDRHYTDPLRADDQWPATPDDEAYPSISTVKKAGGQDWTYVALKRVAQHDGPLPKGFDARYAVLKNINDGGLKEAMNRGTGVHSIAEEKLRGFADPMAIPNADAEQYRAAVDAFFDTYQPELVAVECVAIHRDLNGVGYGGTGDAVVCIDGKYYYIDWKSRGVDSDHGGYPEEGAQVSAYARAQYWIVDGPRRIAPVPLDGGLIVSIKPDGFRVYPVDLDKGFDHWTAMHAWWCARRDERKAIGRPWAPRKAEPCPTPATADSEDSGASSLTATSDGISQTPTACNASDGSTLTSLRQRIRNLPPDALVTMRELWPIGVPKGPKGPFTDEQIERIATCLDKTEWQHNIIPPDPPKPDRHLHVIEAVEAWQPPEEGPDVDLTDVKARVTGLDAAHQMLFNAILVESGHAGRSFHVLTTKGGRPTLRRALIVDALADAIEAADGSDELLRLMLGSALGEELQPVMTLGMAAGSLSVSEATHLALLAKAFTAQTVYLDVKSNTFKEINQTKEQLTS